MKVSLICATVGPLSEVVCLIDSIIRAIQRVESEIFVEFILIDQSDDSPDHPFPISNRLHLIHIHNHQKGLSLNRNIGLAWASGDWVMIMDSDCTVSEDYFRNLTSLIQAHPGVSHFVGRILEPSRFLPLFRNWPRGARRISKLMLWYYATSVNSLFRAANDKPRFDERFGLGAQYGSCEDVDFFLRLSRSCFFSPDLVVFHPDTSCATQPREKLDSYSFGFGALCAKYALPLGFVMLVASLLKKTLDVLRGKTGLNDLARAAAFRAGGFVRYFFDKTLGGHV